jgi:hypothetical protein
MYPIIQWTLTYVNIGQYQAPGYHTIGNTKTFLPGSYGSGGIFVPVYSQEAIYNFNYAPSVKPTISGWYVGSQSQSTSTSTSKSTTPPQLSNVQEAINNAQQAVSNIQQLASSSGSGLASTTYVYYSNTLFQTITQPGPTQFIPFTPPPFYYSNQDIQSAYATAWSDFVHGNILGAIYYAGKGAYMQSWNTLASAVYSAYEFMQSAKNAFNTATLAKNIGLAFNVLNPFGK